jgi:hypothetical protein
LNNPERYASVTIGMKFRLFVLIGLVSFLAVACEQQQPAPPAASPTPAESPPLQATPEATPPTTPPPAPEASPTPAEPATPPANPEASPTESPSTSDARPTFKSDRANQYVATYDSYIEEFKVAYEAMKHNDLSKYQTVVAKAQELQSQGEQLAGELSPEEQRRFADYLNRKSDELAQYASQNQ